MIDNLKRITPRMWAVLLALTLIVGAMPMQAMAYSPWNSNYTQEELALIARVVYAEAAGEPYEGKIAVAAIILNRVRSDQFPDTVAGVVYERWQFSCVGNYMFSSEPSRESYQAALDALHGWDPTYGALYYWNYHQVTNSWLWAKPTATVIGSHWFAY
jgi:N-acetylmuramoyl-L-alanine amidase